MSERDQGVVRERDEDPKDDAAASIERAKPEISDERQDAEFERQMEIARKVMRDFRPVLAALAK